MFIRQMDILVHPDYYRWGNRNTAIHPLQHKLHADWLKRADEVSKKEDSILMYFSSFDRKYLDDSELDDRARILLGSSLINLRQEELRRLELIKSLFKDRMVTYGQYDFPTPNQLQSLFSDKRFVYSPSQTEVYGYGELLEACVVDWTVNVVDGLGIPREKITFLPDYSLSVAKLDELDLWRGQQEGCRHLQMRK